MEESQLVPRVSALIVSCNSAGPLRRCLAALERSEERDRMEVLVVDAGSRDESPQLDSEFPSVTFLRLPKNFGLVKAMNIGMRTAKGEFFFFVDPNVEVLPGAVPALAARLEAETEAVAVCPLLVTPEGGAEPDLYQLPGPKSIGRAARAGRWEPAGAVDLGKEKIQVEFPGMAALMARSYFLKGIRYIDERYGNSWAGAEICHQIRRASRRVLLFPGIRATRHPEPARVYLDTPRARALLEADWALGAAAFAAKHFGFGAGLKVRLSALPGRPSRLMFVLTGQKIDGTQTGL
jgi:GT2 family glycosyltransferase